MIESLRRANMRRQSFPPHITAGIFIVKAMLPGSRRQHETSTRKGSVAHVSDYDPQALTRHKMSQTCQPFQVFLTIFTHIQNLFTGSLFHELLRAVQIHVHEENSAF